MSSRLTVPGTQHLKHIWTVKKSFASIHYHNRFKMRQWMLNVETCLIWKIHAFDNDEFLSDCVSTQKATHFLWQWTQIRHRMPYGELSTATETIYRCISDSIITSESSASVQWVVFILNHHVWPISSVDILYSIIVETMALCDYLYACQCFSALICGEEPGLRTLISHLYWSWRQRHITGIVCVPKLNHIVFAPQQNQTVMVSYGGGIPRNASCQRGATSPYLKTSLPAFFQVILFSVSIK